jgi:predicted amidohydrolase YtcJ
MYRLLGEFKKMGLLTILGAILIGGCSGGSAVKPPADLVLTNGKVVTLDPAQPVAEAIAVRGPWIVAVGSADEIAPWIAETTEVVDLEGRLTIPGFIEGHGHFMSLGTSKTTLDLTAVESWDEVVSMVEEAAAAAEPGEWIRGHGWHQEKWISLPENLVEGIPVHDELSRMSAENPVLLTHASGHAAFANAEAMRIAGVDREVVDPPGGTFVRDSDGELTGLLRETAQRVVSSAMERQRSARSESEIEAENRRLVELAGQEALAHGITSFHDAGASFETIDFFKRLESEGELPVRLYVMVRHESNDAMAESLQAYRTVAQGDDYLAVRSIKRQIDGALGSHGAWLLEPYADLSSSVGLVLETEEEIRQTAEIALENGFQLNTHAIGDRANRAVLDIYQEAFERHGDAEDLRWRVEHAQHLSRQDIDRFAALGIIAAVQGIHCTSDAPWVLKRLGAERAEEGAYVWRDLIDSGALLVNGTDAPVESIDPIASFYSSVSRRTGEGDLFYPDQAMTREEALSSYTLNAAYAAFEEDSKGSLEVGKLADVVVLSLDLLTIPIEEIPSVQIDMTILGGEVRYSR